MELKEVDLTKGENSEHPDIKIGNWYIALIRGHYWAGRFTEVWYGLCFLGWAGGTIQYDKPGTNSSGWERLWEMVDA